MVEKNMQLDLEKLYRLIKKTGNTLLLEQVLQQIESGQFDDTAKISLLLELSKSERVSLADMANCFSIGSAGTISSFFSTLGIKKTHKRTRALIVTILVTSLSTPEGQAKIRQVMTKAARSKKYWSSGGIKSQKVVRELLPSLDDRDSCFYAWNQITQQELLIPEHEKPGVILLYGLGVNPTEYLQQKLVREQYSVTELAREINKRCEQLGILTISGSTLGIYARVKRIMTFSHTESSAAQYYATFSRLNSPEGQRKAALLMKQAARDKSYWKQDIDRHRILLELGFPKKNKSLRSPFWKLLRDNQIIEYEELVNVVLYYGFGIKDPTHFLQEQLDKSATVRDLHREFSKWCRENKTLTVSYTTLKKHLDRHAILRKV